MPTMTILFGLILAIFGYVGYTESVTASKTALIPSYFGLALIVCGAIGQKPSLRKHAMHAAAMIALLGCIGAAYMGIRKVPGWMSGELSDVDRNKVRSQVMTALLLGLYVAVCINSFIQARRARASQSGGGPA